MEEEIDVTKVGWQSAYTGGSEKDGLVRGRVHTCVLGVGVSESNESQ